MCLKRESHSRERERKRFTKNSNSLNERDIFKHQTQLWEREGGEKEGERDLELNDKYM